MTEIVKQPQIILVGSGPMAVDYWRVLDAMSATVTTVGRSQAAANAFCEKTGVSCVTGGLAAYLDKVETVPTHAIVAVGVEQLTAVAHALIERGVKQILLEKPGALDGASLAALAQAARHAGAGVFIAYNRRFYASTLAAQALIAQEGGALSVAFEFTEWSHVIGPLVKAPGVKERWLIGNSTHVIDLAFFLTGDPVEICSFTGGALDWHPAGSIFAGAGRTDRGAVFSYQANWTSAGRWGVEVMLPSQRLILRPLEMLQSIATGTIPAIQIEIDDSLDKQFKPGLYRQTEAFLAGDASNLCTLDNQLAKWAVYGRMAGYPADA